MTEQERDQKMQVILRKKLTMPPVEVNAFIANRDTLSATAKGIYVSLLAHILLSQEYGREIDDRDIDIWLDSGFNKITESQMRDALANLASEGLLYKDEYGEWVICDLNNNNNAKAEHNLHTQTLGGAK